MTCKATTVKGKRCKRKVYKDGLCSTHTHNLKHADDPDGLNEAQRRFVELYLGEAFGNATESYVQAYGVDNRAVAASSGSTLLRNPKVQAAIARRMDQDQLVSSREDTLRDLTMLAAGYDPIDPGDPVEVKDRLRAMELLVKIRGDAVQKVEHSGNGHKAVIILPHSPRLGDGENDR